MTNTEIIQAIKAEIERLKSLSNQLDYKNAVGFNWALDDVLSFLDTLESEHLADASKTSPNNLEEPVCEELSNETFRIEFKKIEHQCFEEGIVGWQKEKLIARHFYELGLNARKEEIK